MEVRIWLSLYLLGAVIVTSHCRGRGGRSSSRRRSTCTTVHGKWADWGEWSTCICEKASASAGTWTSSRTCTNPPPSCGGNSCTGDSRRTENCTKDCAVADCTTLNSTWSNILTEPDLPVENGKDIALSCVSSHYLIGSNSSTCHNGTVAAADDLPVCLFKAYWGDWTDWIPSSCGNITVYHGNLQGTYSCAKLRNRTCLHESDQYTCDGHVNNVFHCSSGSECSVDDESPTVNSSAVGYKLGHGARVLISMLLLNMN